MRLFDTHCHLNIRHFKDDWKEVYERAKDVGVLKMVIVGWDASSSEKAVKMAKELDGVYAACGFHPHDSKLFNEVKHVPFLKELISHPKTVALGEIGLDYYYDNSPRDVQRSVFERQLALAVELDVPVIIHLRDAYEDAFSIIRDVGLPRSGGVLHCYSGGTKFLDRSLNLGLYISFAGVVTFPKAVDLREASRLVPEDRLLIETDAPYLAPKPYRGRRNEPAYLIYVLREVARVKRVDEAELAKITYENAIKFFKLNGM